MCALCCAGFQRGQLRPDRLRDEVAHGRSEFPAGFFQFGSDGRINQHGETAHHKYSGDLVNELLLFYIYGNVKLFLPHRVRAVHLFQPVAEAPHMEKTAVRIRTNKKVRDAPFCLLLEVYDLDEN